MNQLHLFFACLIICSYYYSVVHADSISQAIEYAEDGYADGQHGPSEWHQEFPLCGAGHYFERQSPVNIPLNTEVEGPSQLTPIKTGYHEFTNNLTNTGFSIQIDAHPDKPLWMEAGLAPYVTRNRAANVDPINWTMVQVHLHWNDESNEEGSEHSLGEKYYPMEIHFVHSNSEINDGAEVIQAAVGLAVIGILFDVGEENAALKPITDAAPEISLTGQTVPVTLDPNLFLENMDMSDYYAYAGSLTTPPCYESVTWILMNKVLTMSQEQLDNLRTFVGDGDQAEHSNHRPTQELNDRLILTKTGAMNEFQCSGLTVGV